MEKKIERLMSIDFNCKTTYGNDDDKKDIIKKNNTIQIIHLYTLLDIMIMMLLDHYV